MELEFNNLDTLLNTLGDRLIDIYRKNLAQTDTNASGALGNTINYIVEKDDLTYSVDINIEDYWKYIEEGRRPGKFPSVESIRNWVRIKPVIPRPFNGKLPTENQLVYLIGKKIQDEGTEGKHLMQLSLEELEMNWMQLIDAAIQKDLENQVDIQFKNF